MIQRSIRAQSCHPEAYSPKDLATNGDAGRASPNVAPPLARSFASTLRMTMGVALALMAISCGRSESASPTTNRTGSTLRIVYIPKNTGNPYFDPLIEGFRIATGECGAEFGWVAPAT